jgi:hypothetical protein
VIGVGKKFVVTLLVMRTFFHSQAAVDAVISRGLTAESRFNSGETQ